MPKRKLPPRPRLTPSLMQRARLLMTRRARIVYGLMVGAGWKEFRLVDYELVLAELDGWGLAIVRKSKRRGFIEARARVLRPRARRST